MLEIVDSRSIRHEDVKVDYGFFDKFRKPSFHHRHNKSRMIYPKITLKHKHTSYDEPSMSPDHEGEERFQSRVPKPILRRRSFNENEKSRPGSNKEEGKDEQPNEKEGGKKESRSNKQQKETEIVDEKLKETTINGIPLSKLPREVREKRERAAQKRANKVQKVQKEIEIPPIKEEKTVEELEKEGAQNFARCLLGILPSVLSATEPSVTDEALQQFSSDVCEAVTCLALRRKNVPNFGSVRKHDIKQDENDSSYDEDPSLNADGVYKTVYETLNLSFRLNKSGFYKKKNPTLPMTQVS